jgi:cytochrome oxidase Cu insertion factor (SCO1/SenC/PrrC family)
MIVKPLMPSLAFAALLSAAGPPGHAQQPAPSVDTATLGPQVGTVVPPVSGVDQFGQSQTLATLSGPKGLMLVFSRSADW